MPQDEKFVPPSLPEARPARTKGVIRARLSPVLKATLEIMAYEGEPLAKAAQRAGMAYESAIKAMRRPHVKQAYNQLVAEIRHGAGQAAYLRINHLGHTAASEAVKLDANKWIAGVDNIAPVKRVEGRFSHSHSFAGFEFGDADTAPPIDGAATEVSTDISSGGDDE